MFDYDEILDVPEFDSEHEHSMDEVLATAEGHQDFTNWYE